MAGSLLIAHKDSEGNTKRTIDLSRPWKRARYEDLIRQVDHTWYERNHDQKLMRCQELGVEVHSGMQEFEITQQVFEKLVEERTIDPLFVTHLPVELVPLAKQNAENPALVDVYELIINGQEISPGYSELNDPLVQRRRLTEQVGEEIQDLDEDFLARPGTWDAASRWDWGRYRSTGDDSHWRGFNSGGHPVSASETETAGMTTTSAAPTHSGCSAAGNEFFSVQFIQRGEFPDHSWARR